MAQAFVVDKDASYLASLALYLTVLMYELQPKHKTWLEILGITNHVETFYGERGHPHRKTMFSTLVYLDSCPFKVQLMTMNDSELITPPPRSSCIIDTCWLPSLTQGLTLRVPAGHAEHCAEVLTLYDPENWRRLKCEHIHTAIALQTGPEGMPPPISFHGL